jgi:hypothetical protein
VTAVDDTELLSAIISARTELEYAREGSPEQAAWLRRVRELACELDIRTVHAWREGPDGPVNDAWWFSVA